MEAWEQADGFTGAQALVNLLECSGYGVYLLIVYMYGRETSGKGRGAPEGLRGYMSRLARPRAVEGSMGSLAAVLGFAIAVATFSKTMLYGMCLRRLRSRSLIVAHGSGLDLYCHLTLCR